MSIEFLPCNPTALAAAMEPESTERYNVYLGPSGEIFLESDTNLLPPKVGMLIHLPSHSGSQEINLYRVSEVWVAREGEERVGIYVELEPA